MSKKLGTTRTEDESWPFVVVRLDLASGDCDEIDRCATDTDAEKTCLRLNIGEGFGPDFVYAYMESDVFDALDEAPDEDDDEDEDDDVECFCDVCMGYDD